MRERRASPRSAVRIAVRIVTRVGAFDATMVNISHDGARLIMDERHWLTGRIYLWVSKIVTLFECEVRWQRDNNVGLQFIDTSAQSLQRAIVKACASAAMSTIVPMTRH
jgi:hypothetical protein